MFEDCYVGDLFNPFCLTQLCYATCYVSAGGDAVWIISAEDRAKHNAQFEQLKPVNGFVSGIPYIYLLKLMSVLHYTLYCYYIII